MEAIRKIIKIQNGSISLKELEKLNGEEVEIIILPLVSQSQKKAKNQKKKFFKFKGAVESGFTDTSTNVDKLIYGQ